MLGGFFQISLGGEKLLFLGRTVGVGYKFVDLRFCHAVVNEFYSIISNVCIFEII